jgi:hypothetical protein
LLRMVNGGHAYELIDGHLRNLDHRTVVAAAAGQPFNPGSTGAERTQAKPTDKITGTTDFQPYTTAGEPACFST